MIPLLSLKIFHVLDEEGVWILSILVTKVSFADTHHILNYASSPHVNVKDLIFLNSINNIVLLQIVTPCNLFL